MPWPSSSSPTPTVPGQVPAARQPGCSTNTQQRQQVHRQRQQAVPAPVRGCRARGTTAAAPGAPPGPAARTRPRTRASAALPMAAPLGRRSRRQAAGSQWRHASAPGRRKKSARRRRGRGGGGVERFAAVARQLLDDVAQVHRLVAPVRGHRSHGARQQVGRVGFDHQAVGRDVPSRVRAGAGRGVRRTASR